MTLHSIYHPVLLSELPSESRRVILVEDNASLRRSIARNLTEWGYAVSEAGTLDEAKALVRDADPITLVLSDYHLPDGTGLEFLEWMSHERHLDPPFILMSGEYLSTRNVLGDFLFLAKPFSAEELKNLLEQCCGAPSMGIDRSGCKR